GWDRFEFAIEPAAGACAGTTNPSDAEIEFMQVERNGRRFRALMFMSASLGAMILFALVEALIAQETKKSEAAPPTPPVPAAAAPAAAPAAAEQAPAATLPPYFAPDPTVKDSPWPDATG